MNYRIIIARISIISIFFVLSLSASSQRSRAQYPGFMQNSYYGINLGYINYPFTNQHLEPGYTAEIINIPHTAVRLILYGRQINDYFSMHISYMRPVIWVTYDNINNQQKLKWVSNMNIGGLTAKAQYPVHDKFLAFSEFGLSVNTRRGFSIEEETIIEGEPVIEQVTVMKDANFASYQITGGMKYRINDKFDLMLYGTYIPASEKENHPYTMFIGTGFQYNMKKLPDETIKANTTTGYIFPKHQLILEYSTNSMGYGVNAFFSEGTIPLFWGGAVEVEKGLSVNYQRNIFHTRSVFSLDLGASASYFNTIYGTDFYTFAAYPVFRFTFLRTQPADMYFFYILGGPTFISDSQIDNVDTGKRFTFHDYMGLGFYTGPSRNIIAEIKIGHYSNGNIFSQNAGVKIPLTFAIGYAF